MRLRAIYFLLFILAYQSVDTQAQITKTHRILILLDGSKSMDALQPGNNSYYSLASRIITQLVQNTYAINADVEYGLRVYGHQYQANSNRCNDTRMEVRFTKDNLAQIALRLQDLKPKGNGSASYAAQQAFEAEMTDTTNYWYSLIWIAADTGKCSATPCNIINSRPRNDLYKLYTIQLKPGVYDTKCFEQTFNIRNDDDVAKALDIIVPNFRKEKKPEPYWGTVIKKKAPEAYIPKTITDTPKASPKPSVAIPTAPISTSKKMGEPKANTNPPVTKVNVPSFSVPATNDSVAALTTIRPRSEQLQQKTAKEVLVKTEVPAFIPPKVEVKRNDSVTLLKTLKPQNAPLKQFTERIAPVKVKAPDFTPPTPERDAVALLTTIRTKGNLPTTKIPIMTFKKVVAPIYIPQLIVIERDSVALLNTLPTKTKADKLPEKRVDIPKPANVPAFTPKRDADIIAAATIKNIKFTATSKITTPTPKYRKPPDFKLSAIPAEEVVVVNEPPAETIEPVTEEIIDPDAIPAIVHGNLNVKAFGSTIRVQVYRIKLGEDILVSDNSFTGPRQLKIKLEPGRYKMRYNLNDGTEVTKPFLIDEETDTHINVK